MFFVSTIDPGLPEVAFWQSTNNLLGQQWAGAEPFDLCEIAAGVAELLRPLV